MKNLDKEALRREATGRWNYIMSILAPPVADAAQRGHRKHSQCPMPFHGGEDDFRVFKDFDDNGGAICTCGAYTDGFSVLMAVHGWDFPTVLEEVNGVLNRHGHAPKVVNLVKRMKNPKPVDLKKVRERLRDAYDLSKPASAQEASSLWVYFLAREIWPTVDVLEDVRFARALPYYDGDGKLLGEFPAMLSVIRDKAGKPVSIHRTYLNKQCSGKASVPKAKKLMETVGSLDGAAIRLGKPTRVLGIAEGIETALAVSQATGTTCWAAVSAPILGNFQPPAGTERVVIWADKDRSGAGERYAQKLKNRLEAQGIPAVIMLPQQEIPEGAKSVDWLDVVAAKSQEMQSITQEVSNG